LDFAWSLNHPYSLAQSHATEVRLRAAQLRRLSFAVFASASDHFARFLPTIAEILVEALKVQRYGYTCNDALLAVIKYHVYFLIAISGLHALSILTFLTL
jgi:hypothetical protein